MGRKGKSKQKNASNPLAKPQQEPQEPAPAVIKDESQKSGSKLATAKKSAQKSTIFVNCDCKTAAEFIQDAIDRKLIPEKSAFVQTLKSKDSQARSMIKCDSKDIKIKLIGLLKEKKFEFHSYAEKNEKPKFFILKGLSGFNDKQVKALITKNLKGYPARILRFTNSEEEEIPSVFRVSFSNRAVNLDMLQTKYSTLGCIEVEWEKHQKEVKVLQCYRCQGFGHLSTRCNYAYTCVKCAGDHGPANCRRHGKDSKSVALKCANCDEDHAANFRGCKARMEYFLMLCGKRTVPDKKKEDEVTEVEKPKGPVIERQERMIRLLMEKCSAQKELIDTLQANN